MKHERTIAAFPFLPIGKNRKQYPPPSFLLPLFFSYLFDDGTKNFWPPLPSVLGYAVDLSPPSPFPSFSPLLTGSREKGNERAKLPVFFLSAQAGYKRATPPLSLFPFPFPTCRPKRALSLCPPPPPHLSRRSSNHALLSPSRSFREHERPSSHGAGNRTSSLFSFPFLFFALAPSCNNSFLFSFVRGGNGKCWSDSSSLLVWGVGKELSLSFFFFSPPSTDHARNQKLRKRFSLSLLPRRQEMRPSPLPLPANTPPPMGLTPENHKIP